MTETVQEPGVRVSAPAPGTGAAGQTDFAVGNPACDGDGDDYGEAWEAFVAKFNRHAAAWEGAAFLFLSEMVRDEDYLAIIDMGPRVVPLILQRLEAKPHWWFSALIRLTGEDPTERQHLGKLMEMRAIWLDWARKQNLLPAECRH